MVYSAPQVNIFSALVVEVDFYASPDSFDYHLSSAGVYLVDDFLDVGRVLIRQDEPEVAEIRKRVGSPLGDVSKFGIGELVVVNDGLIELAGVNLFVKEGFLVFAIVEQVSLLLLGQFWFTDILRF